MNTRKNIECGCIDGSVGIINTRIVGSIELINTFITGSVGIICTPNTEVYLRVDPKIVWMSPEDYAEFNIYSNTRWEID